MGLSDFFRKLLNTTSDESKNIPTAIDDSAITAPALRNANTPFANVNFLSKINGRPLEQTSDYYYLGFDREFAIHDPLKKHKDMIEAGFLVKAPLNVSIAYNYKVSDLKNILEKFGLKKAGNKEELIRRLIDEANTDSLKINPVYILSSSGKEYVTKYHYYVEAVKYLDCDLTIQMFDSAKKIFPDKSVQEIVFHLYQTLDQKYIDSRFYWRLGYNQKKKFNVLIELQNYKDAGYYAIVYIYLKLSGMTDYGIDDYKDLSLDMSYKDCLNTVEIFNIPVLVNKCYKEYRLPFHYFKPQVTSEIITRLYNGEEVSLASYRKKAARPSSYSL